MSHFSQEEVSVYEACTCLDGAELATLYATFISMGGRRVPKGAEESVYRFVVGQKTVKNMTAGADVAISQVQVDSTRKSQAHKATETQKVTKKQVCDLPEFDNNPFATRLCEVFSSDGSGDLNFDELLDMFHVLSPKAEKEVKILTAFRVYDFDGDGYLDAGDISALIRTTTVVHKKPKLNRMSRSSSPSPRASVSDASSRASACYSPRVVACLASQRLSRLSEAAAAVERDLENGTAAPAQAEVRRELSPVVLSDIVDHVMRECDLDGRGRLSFHEFKRVMERFPDVEAKLSVSILSS